MPADFREMLMHENHASVYGGHLGFEKTLAKIRQRYYWANMFGVMWRNATFVTVVSHLI